MSKHDPRLKILAGRIEEMVLATGTLAATLLDSSSNEGSDPPPFLDQGQAEALMTAIVHLSRATHDDFCSLVDLAGVPQ